jgi:hypothetical protein
MIFKLIPDFLIAKISGSRDQSFDDYTSIVDHLDKIIYPEK